MPGVKVYYNNRRKYKKKSSYYKGKKKTLPNKKLSLRDLQSNKIDSKIELALANKIKYLAKQEIQKELVFLVKRDFIWSKYNRDLNEFDNNGTAIHFKGIPLIGNFNTQISEIGGIPMMDNDTRLIHWTTANNTPVINDPNQNNDLNYAQVQALIGDNVVAPQTSFGVPNPHGFRTSASVKINSCSLDLRVILEEQPDDSDYAPILIKVAIIAVRNQLQVGDNFVLPLCEELMNIPTFGKSTKLDITQNDQESKWKKKTLLMIERYIKPNVEHNVSRFYHVHKTLKTPLIVNFLSDDQSGFNKLTNYKIYVVARSSTAVSAAAEHTPKISVCSKLNYTSF